MEPKVKVTGGLESFIEEVGRWSRTGGFHYNVVINENRIEIVHHNGKWMARLYPTRCVVFTDSDVLVITKNTMTLNNEEIEELCSSRRCYKREDIVNKLILAVLLYDCSVAHRLRRWISG